MNKFILLLLPILIFFNACAETTLLVYKNNKREEKEKGNITSIAATLKSSQEGEIVIYTNDLQCNCYFLSPSIMLKIVEMFNSGKIDKIYCFVEDINGLNQTAEQITIHTSKNSSKSFFFMPPAF
ncbi:MAG: hypothetical protein HY096_08965 [Nitrospinae bacterium]|nr:hypothetical protein [Nitrospinota bacterium]